MVRTTLFARPALALAAALATVSGAALLTAPAIAAAKKPEPAKAKYSKPFQAAAVPLDKVIADANKRPDVAAAIQAAEDARLALNNVRGAANRTAATAKHTAAIAALGATLAPERAQLEAVNAVATTPDDKLYAGQMYIRLGALAQDFAMQRRGVQAMIDSGQIAAAELPRMQYSLGSLAYDAKDYAAARTALGSAIAGGYTANGAQALLAEAHLVDGQVPLGLQLLKKAITDERAAGRVPLANWYKRGIGAAYTAKLVDDAVWFSTGLVENYPSKEHWAGAIAIIREVAKYGPQETLDLMRLMHRTESFQDERDYVEYIEAADGRRSPGEVIKIIKLGLAASKLRTDDIFVAEQRRNAEGRLVADTASLPGLDREARSASATAATTMAAGDAFLSYDQPAKAAELYAVALGKPGVDSARALTRLGIAQYDLGQLAEAEATFAKVTGPRQATAKLWILQTQIKRRPAAAAAPAAP